MTTTPTQLPSLVAQWEQHKEAERLAVEARRKIEDDIVALLSIPDSLDGVKNVEVGDEMTLKITGRLDRKVDEAALNDVLLEHPDLRQHVDGLFRTKHEISVSAWKHADASITKPFAAAVTTKPGRPSFAVNRKEK